MNNKADLSKVRVEVKWHEDMWQEIKDATMTTVGKNTGKYPDSKWKKKILMCEHSPIRIGHIIVKIYDAPQFVHGHLVRHHNGATPFVSTLRSDRNDYDETPDRNTLQSATYDFNFQAFINISRKRKCNCASYETRYVWNKVLEAIKPYEPELYDVCVKDCIYRGYCYEFNSCNYHTTNAFKKELEDYRKGINECKNEEYKNRY